MRLVATNRIREGVKLGRDVLTGRADGVPLLRAGVQLNDRYRGLLSKAGVSAIYVADETSEGIEIETGIDDETRALATVALARAFETAHAAFARGERMRLDRIDELQDIVGRILDQIQGGPGAAIALADLHSADAYTFQHSIDVTVLGLLVGQRHIAVHGWTDHMGEQRWDDAESMLSTLGLGLLLHDIGKLTVPLGIINKPGKLTPQEWAIMQTHPRAGFDMLEAGDWSPLVKGVVLRHHERWNGSGYPDGRAGKEIHAMARIAAVADVYDAVSSTRSYAPARLPGESHRVILEGSGTLFDPDVVACFRDVMAPFPAGTEVKLTDGREGIVARINAEALDRPIVRILEDDVPVGEVSLLDDPSLQIVGWERQSPEVEPAR